MPFLHSPSNLVRPAGTLFAFFFFSRCHLHALPFPHPTASVSLRGELLCMSAASVFMCGGLVFMAAAQGMLLDHLALEPGELAFLGPMGV